ncbi:probable serine/threonine-protein kinase tsuA isoform X2 [Ochlerotatus camptorhynchus]|uniref:probable serine/threonine-protein kinase tsuA isoform X2 n=1 Tax=Ochlerotatus camptorhynchus TaxID=644619 RepID=UPI0031D1FE2B
MEQLQIQTTELPFCRLCFTQGIELYEIFPGAGNDNESLLIKIMDCVTVAITFDDDYNSYICAKCVTTIEEFYEYKEKCKENDTLLREKRKSVDQTAIYNVVNMQPEEEVVNANGSNGAVQELAIDDQQIGLEHRISIEGGAPLNGNIIEFKKQLFTASPEQLGIWICVASGSDIQCPAMIQVDENVQVVAEIGQHNHGLPVSVTDNPPQDTKPQMTTPEPQLQQQQQQQQQQLQQEQQQQQQLQQQQQQQEQPQQQQPQVPQQQIVVTGSTKVSGAASTSTTAPSCASKKRKSKDQPSKRKISNDILVGDGWLVDVESQQRHHYQLVTKDGYQTFLIFNGYRFRTQQKIRNGIASWKCAWNGRKGCQAILHITEDYQKVKEVGNPHNHEPSLRDRMICGGKPTNGSDSMLLGSDGEESLHAGSELQHITIAAAIAGHATSSNSNSSTLGNAVTATITGGGGPSSTIVTSNAVSNLDVVTTSVSHSSSLEHLSTSEIVDFVQQSSSGSDQMVTTVVDADSHHAAVVGGVGSVVSVVDDDVGKDDTAMPMDIEEIIRPHVVLHPTNE